MLVINLLNIHATMELCIIMNNEEKLNMLRDMYSKHGNFKVHYMKNKNVAMWKTWKYYTECTNMDLINCNLRSVFDDEIVLDLEEASQSEHIRDMLQKFGFSFDMWFTGSRGFHYSLTFNELKSFNEDQRKKIRESFIRIFDCDISKKSGLIALEYSNHFKTGNPKSLILSYIGNAENRLPQKFIDDAMYIKKFKAPTQPFEIEISKDPVFQYVINNKLGNGHRNNVLLKNLAIALYNNGLRSEEVYSSNTCMRIISNMPGKTMGEISGWIRLCEQGKIKDYNIIEINKWIKESELDIPLYKRRYNGSSKG